MADWKEQLLQIQTQRLQVQQSDEALYAILLQLQMAIDAAKKTARGETGQDGNNQRDNNIALLQAEAIRISNELVKGRASLHDQIGGLFTDPHPRNAVANMDDGIPFLLLPVRIETCFVNAGQTNELWVRVYPDEIAIHTHEKILTDDEVTAGEVYWTEIFNAEKANAANKEDRKKKAWSVLADSFNPQRSAWVALQTKPANWNLVPAGVATDKDLLFPPNDLTKTNAWSRAPRTNVMPDKMVVQLYVGDIVVEEVVGNIIPDELFMGPDPMDAKKAFQTIDDKLVFGDSYDWTADFDKAIALGMGFKIAITAQQAINGFEKILALGVFISADEMTGKSMLEDLLDNHHYSPNGLSLVTQGTPTNNTDQNESGYSNNDPFNNISYFTETGDPLFDDKKDCDGRNLADALGIEYGPLQFILNSNATDYSEAVAMNKALYPATLGFYFATMLHPVLSDNAQETLRNFFTANVTGRGALPAIRVGDQPYGVLLTSDFTNWNLGQGRVPGNIPPGNIPFLQETLNLLRYYSSIWTAQIPALNFAGKPGTDPSTVLMDILGLQAGSVEFYQRNGYSTDDIRNQANFQQGKKYYDDLSKSFKSKDDLLIFFNSMGLNTASMDPPFTIPQLLRLVYQHYTSTLDANNLIDNVPLSEENHIRPYAAGNNYLNWLAAATTPDILEKQDFGAGIPAPNALLYLLLRKALLEQLHNASANWLINRSVPVQASMMARNFNNIRPDGDLSKWEVMKAPVSIAAPALVAENISVASYLLTIGINENESLFLKEVKDALTTLANLPTARLERCFTEHLDACTYRLDAWQNALFRIRMQQQRQIADGADKRQRRKGIYLGAYGWVENIRPSAKQIIPGDTVPEKLRPANKAPLYSYNDNGGFVHAPSLNHASAAAVLRSGYLSHADAANPESMAVNLSSERVRRALFILEGIQNGQQLEALLGYQFERGLHDQASANNLLLSLNAFIYDFRDAYPIQQHQIQQQGTDVSTNIPANNVVNGVTLAEAAGGFPFGAKGDVLGASTDAQKAITIEQGKLADTLDAVKDLLLSESVYQLVLGNFDRAGAVITALKDSKIPPVLDVIDTPRSSNFTFTNRVTVQFENLDPTVTANNPWAPTDMTQRAKMEPGINKWIASLLGQPKNIVFRVANLDAEGNELGSAIMNCDTLNLQPIDLIYITGNELNTGANNPGASTGTAASELEQRIAYRYRQDHSLGDEVMIQIQFLPTGPLPGKIKLGEMLPLLRMLKSLITDSRYLNAVDFDSPSKKSIADPANPKGYDAVDLNGRVLQARNAASSFLNGLNSITIQTQITDKNGVVSIFMNLQDSFAALDAAAINFADAEVVFSDIETSDLQKALINISYTGIPDAFPQIAFSLTDKNKNILLEQARAVARKLTKAIADAKTAFDAATALTDPEKKTLQLIASAQFIFDSVFNVVPLFTYNNEADIQQSFLHENDLLDYAGTQLGMLFPADEWLQHASHTRARIARWDNIRTLNETLNAASIDLHVVQIPFRKKDSWVAIEFPATYPGLDADGNLVDLPFTISHDTLSVVVNGDAAFIPAGKQCGLLLDDWTELIPGKDEITGIGFNYNRPNAMPPQALMLAVPPAVTGHWNWDSLVNIMNDTLVRAKARAVDTTILDTIDRPELSVLLPAILSNFTQYDLDVALDMRVNVSQFAKEAPIMTAAQFKK